MGFLGAYKLWRISETVASSICAMDKCQLLPWNKVCPLASLENLYHAQLSFPLVVVPGIQIKRPMLTMSVHHFI